MNMRQQFTKTTEFLVENDRRVVTLLGDIGVFGFSKLMAKYPTRVYNIGILEQATIGVAAGLSMMGMVPIVHTIAPFIVERAYEQLKIDFGYQNINGNFVSVGASYDYAGLGSTHHCPADVPSLKNIPNMQVAIPGTAIEFDGLFKESYCNGKPTYYRLSEAQNVMDFKVKFGCAHIVKQGEKATVIAVGTMLNSVLEATKNLDVTVLYYTTVAPFDKEILLNNCDSKKILVCEPYYYGALDTEIIDTFLSSIRIEHIGVPHKFITNYGSLGENNQELKLTKNEIYKKLEMLINE